MKDKRINTGSIEIQIREYEGNGDAIIFLHFGGGNLMMWQDVVPYFQDNYHLVLIDLRGHGKSDKPQKGYHTDEMAGDVVKVMQALGLEEAHIVGSSLGAEVGLSMAANYPEMVLSLVCEGALYSEYGPYGLWKGSEAEFKAHATETMEKIRDTPEKVYPSIDALVEESRKTFEERGWWNETFEAVKRYDAHKIGEGKYTKGWRKFISEDYTEKYLFYRLEDYYRQVKCPLLMLPDEIPGQDEREKEVMAGLFKLLDHGKIVSVPEWIHPFGWIVDPRGACEAILEFLAEVRD